MLSKCLRMIVKHLLEGLTEHGSLRRDNNAARHLDKHLIATDILRGHASWEAVLSRAKKHRVLDLWTLDSTVIAPFEENVELLLCFLDFRIIKPLAITLARLARFCHSFDRIEQLQEAKLCFDLHFV